MRRSNRAPPRRNRKTVKIISAGPAIAARSTAGCSTIRRTISGPTTSGMPMRRNETNIAPASNASTPAVSRTGVGVPAGVTNSRNDVARNGSVGYAARRRPIGIWPSPAAIALAHNVTASSGTSPALVALLEAANTAAKATSMTAATEITRLMGQPAGPAPVPGRRVWKRHAGSSPSRRDCAAAARGPCRWRPRSSPNSRTRSG